MLKILTSACVFTMLAFTSTTTHAQTIDNRTYFTFSGPVTLPGVTLPAGKYLFRNPDTLTGRRVVQVLSEDGRQAFAQLLTIPVQRFDAPKEPEIRFMETAEGTPAAIKAWWYPGSTIGWEFIYPKEQALRLAKGAGAPVLTTTNAQNDTTEEMKSADLTRVSASGGETAVTVEEKPAATAVAGTSQEGEIAASSVEVPASPTPVSVQANATTGTTRTRLPQTASPAPFVALMGTLSVMGAAAVRAMRRLSRKSTR